MKRSKKVGFAVLGLGAIARSSVLPAFKNAKSAELIALVSRDKRKAISMAREFKAKAAYSVEEFDACLANPSVHAVYIATPPGEHLEAVDRVARAGKHVLCEKPLAATAEQSAKIVEVCEQHGVKLMTAYRKHFEPSTLFLKNLVRSGKFGTIDMVHTVFSELHIAGKSVPWLLDARLAGGGPLMDLGVYCLNTTRWMLEEDPTEVDAVSWKKNTERFTQVEEGISFRAQFPSGCILQASTTYSSAISSFMFVQGEKGWACLTPAFPFDEDRLLTGKIKGKGFSHNFKIVDEFAPELESFAQAILKNRPVQPDGKQGHRDMRIIDAIYESASKQTPVVIRY